MNLDKQFIQFQPIGFVQTPFKSKETTPKQSQEALGVKGTVKVFPEFSEGLKDLANFSYIILVCYFHLSKEFSLTIIPRDEKEYRGLFSTRSPNRPNPIGLSIVRLNQVVGCDLHIQDLDIIDGTPLLDIKPFYRSLDDKDGVISGWMRK